MKPPSYLVVGAPARRRWRSAARIGLALWLAVSVAACTQNAGVPATYEIPGALDLVPHDPGSHVTALANPFAQGELALATASIEPDGAFRLVMTPVEEEVLTPAATLFVDTPECSERSLQPGNADLLFVSRYVLTGPDGAHAGDLERSAEAMEHGVVVSETHVFTTAPIRIRANCTFDRSVFSFDLDLAAGWNAYRVHIPSSPETPYRLTSLPAEVALAWRSRVSPPSEPGPVPSPRPAASASPAASSLQPAWSWLHELASPSGASER